MSKATSFLTALESLEVLEAQAEAESLSLETLRDRLRVNAHIHLPPNFSAFETVAQAVDLAAEQSVHVLGASNYYDYTVYGEFAAKSATLGIFPLFGTEIICLLDDLRQAGIKINDPGNPGKMYLCGKGITAFDPLSADAAELLGVIRRNDSVRMAQMVEKLAAYFSAAGIETGLNEAEVKARVVERHGCPPETVYLQERHIAQAFQEVLFERFPNADIARLFGADAKVGEDAVGVQNAIRSYLMKAGKPAFVEETFVDFEHAYRLILALGGIPCYPTLIDGTTPLCPYEDSVERLIAQTRARGIYCAEFIPIRNTPGVLGTYVRAMREAGLIVTAGTEHNTRDLLPIEPTCVGGEPIPEDVQAVFREGACVVAAHQYLTANGKPGFVDAQGRPNPDFATDDARIAHFQRLGQDVLHAYCRTGK